MALSILLFFLTCGAIVQGISGMGFGLVSVPFLVWFFGPIDGIIWANIAGSLLAAGLAIVRRKEVDWRACSWLFMGAVPSIVVSILILRQIPVGYLHLILGLMMLTMVMLSIFALKFPPVSGRKSMIAAGALGAIMSVAVAQSGPVMAAYAQASRWEQNRFAATMQPYFLGLNLIIVPAKIALGMSQAITHLPWWDYVAVVSAILLGLLASRLLVHIVPAKYARDLAICVALVGSIHVIYEALI